MVKISYWEYLTCFTLAVWDLLSEEEAHDVGHPCETVEMDMCQGRNPHKRHTDNHTSSARFFHWSTNSGNGGSFHRQILLDKCKSVQMDVSWFPSQM